ncbi:MAG: DUF393 domain-containing protein [Cyanobacteria bacterium P01_C01_bin.89]
MKHLVIYDGNCNLCTTLVQQLEQWDDGSEFCYVPMQDNQTLAQYNITEQDCEKGMIVIDLDTEEQWQGADAAEKIGLLLPFSRPLIKLYQSIPGLKLFGDTAYSHIRDNRYNWFGKTNSTYWSDLKLSDNFKKERELSTEEQLVMKEMENCDGECLQKAEIN